MANLSEKILFYIPSFEAGGAERQALNLAIELKEKYQYDVIIAAQYSGGPIERECNQLKIDHIVIPFEFYYFKHTKPKSFGLSSIKAYMKYCKQKKAFVNMVLEIKPKYIFSYCYEPNVIAGYFNKYYANTKVIWNQRDTGTPPFDHSEIESVAIKNVYKIVGNSKASVDYFSSNYPINKNVICIPNGIQVKKSSISRQKSDFGFSESDKVIGMIANYAITKNHKILINAYDQLNDESIKLLLIGRFSEKQKLELNKLTKKKIHYHFEEESIASVLTLCDLIVHASASEGMPNAVLEAMFCERMIIASNIDPHKEVLGDNYPYLFETNNVSDLVNKIVIGLKNDQSSIIMMNKKKVNNEFSVQKLALNYHQLIHVN